MSARKLFEAVRRNKADEVTRRAARDPHEMLAVTKEEKPKTMLEVAVEGNCLEAADALLAQMNLHRDTLKAVIAAEPKEYLTYGGDSRYRWLPDPKQPIPPLPHHSETISAEMIRLLHRHGYDLDLQTKRGGWAVDLSLISRLQKRYPKMKDLPGLSPLENQYRAAVECGADIHAPSEKRAFDMPFPDADRNLLYRLVRLNDPELLVRKLRFAAAMGQDLRPMFMPEAFENAPEAESYKVWHYPNITIALTRRAMREFLDAAPERYHAADTPQARADHLRAACAGGTLPRLLNEVPALKMHGIIGSLDTYWKAEYAHSIRAAEATAARSGVALEGGR